MAEKAQSKQAKTVLKANTDACCSRKASKQTEKGKIITPLTSLRTRFKPKLQENPTKVLQLLMADCSVEVSSPESPWWAMSIERPLLGYSLVF